MKKGTKIGALIATGFAAIATVTSFVRDLSEIDINNLKTIAGMKTETTEIRETHPAEKIGESVDQMLESSVKAETTLKVEKESLPLEREQSFSRADNSSETSEIPMQMEEEMGDISRAEPETGGASQQELLQASQTHNPEYRISTKFKCEMAPEV